MLRILWTYINAFFYVFIHFFAIRKRYKNPDEFSIEEKFKYAGKLSKLIVKKMGVKVIVEGKDNLLDGPVLYVSNHPSMIDPYFISYAVDRQLAAIIAGELWFDKVPILTPWFKSFGCVYVDRLNPRKGLEGIKKAIDNIKKGHSLLIFPEGEITNYVSNDSLAPFKSGGLKIATKPKMPIIPVVIVGTNKVYTAHKVIGKLNKGNVIIKILDPYTKHITEDLRAQDVSEDLYNLMKKTIENTKNPC